MTTGIGQPMGTYAEVIRSRAGDDHEGLRFEGRSWTWAEIVDEAAKRAAWLQTFPVDPQRGQRHVAILLQNVPDNIFWILAASLTGDTIVGINPTRRGAELAHDVRHTDCDMLIMEPLYREWIEGLDLGIPEEFILDIESPAYAEKLASYEGAPLPQELPDPAGNALLLFSSGSTGAPKAVICTQGRLGGLAYSLAQRTEVHRNSVSYLTLPLFHGHAIMMNLAPATQVGGVLVMVRKFSASRFIPDLREHGVTYFNYVGRTLNYVLATPSSPEDKDNKLEVVVGSEASPAELATMRERLGFDDIRDGYGLSEGVFRINPVPGSPPDALGLPLGDTEIQIRNPDTNEECPRAEFDEHGRLLNAAEAIGEMVAIGKASAFEGYYNNPEAMASRLKFGGEDFWSGDLGYKDADGYIYFGGRPTDWLRVDGENFGVAPVERILNRYPQFSGAHCFGVPEKATGDLLMLAATLNAGETFDPEAFAQFMDEQPDLGTKWRPTFVRITDAVPLTGSNKINKAPLRDEAWEADDVWYAPTRTSPYSRFTEEDRRALRQAFVDGGRTNALPAAALAKVLDYQEG